MASMLWAITSTSMAASQATASSGLKVCTATHVTRQGGTVIRDTVFGLRNPDETATITIERIQAFGPGGHFLFDSDAFGFPAQPNLNVVLAPHTTSAFSAADLTGPLPGTHETFQVYIHYRLDIPGKPLWVSLSRRTRDDDGYEVTGITGYCSDMPIEE